MREIHVYSDNVYVQGAVEFFISQFKTEGKVCSDVAIFLFERTWLNEYEYHSLMNCAAAEIILFARPELCTFIATQSKRNEVKFICYDSGIEEIKLSLRKIASGMSNVKYMDCYNGDKLKSSHLTQTERKIIELFITGHSVHHIAELMGRDYKTVSSHKCSAMKKMGTRSNIALMQKGPLFLWMYMAANEREIASHPEKRNNEYGMLSNVAG